jgi:hypothetical protein
MLTGSATVAAEGDVADSAQNHYEHSEGDHRLERDQPFTRMVGGSVSVG